jgi:hypothetical protein
MLLPSIGDGWWVGRAIDRQVDGQVEEGPAAGSAWLRKECSTPSKENGDGEGEDMCMSGCLDPDPGRNGRSTAARPGKTQEIDTHSTRSSFSKRISPRLPI